MDEPGRDLFRRHHQQAIGRGTFTSVKELINAIEVFMDGWNDRCEPFEWAKAADEVLAKAESRQKNSNTQH